ncbi:sugar ABC transporter substrate-binding protein [Metabacillus arenae]|uniref:Sugar ABC transporter substrate-binding protein n=1 Tax=Metabacillus arenae TaxID=2771434 RepID=A0A926NGV0_9BACI|nr:sugar ABC transporter substrate-binding protein [Metabacillus arenae]MBD1380550.1 sugar ABC transporter substrate-binding protein [Metabacillus arenae]
MVLKKLGVLFFTIVLVFSLAACSNSDEASNAAVDKEESATLTVWIHPYVSEDLKAEQAKVFDQMAESFKKEYPNVKINYEEIPWANREQKILTALGANQGPDIFYIIPDMMAQFADKGVLTPITDLLGEDWGKEDFSTSSLEGSSYKGELYGLPILQESATYIYNKDILAEVGGDPNNLPKTWDEFNALAEKAAELGYYARNFEGANTPNGTINPIIWQAGGEVINKEGKAAINEPEAVKAFEQVNDWYKKGWIPKDSISALDEHFNLFIEGKMLAVWGSGATVNSLNERNFENYVIGTPIKEQESTTFATTGLFTIPENSEHKKIAAEFIKTMTNTENSIAFNEVTNYIPPRESASKLYEDDEDMKKFAELLPSAKPGVIHPVARTILPKVQAELQAMFEGKKTPQQAADDAAKVINDEINK